MKNWDLGHMRVISRYIRTFQELTIKDVAIVGGKGASLGEMTRAGIPVPSGFVIGRAVFDRCIQPVQKDIQKIINAVNYQRVFAVERASQRIQALILKVDIPRDIILEIEKHFRALHAFYVAVRSSAIEEDSSQAAWAGQLESFLDTTHSQLLLNIKKCWASLFTSRAMVYRFRQGMHHKQNYSMAVVVQKMIASEKSGVAFSIHPITQNKKRLLIEAGWGLGEAVVSGAITPHNYVVDKRTKKIISKHICAQAKGLYRSRRSGPRWRTIARQRQNQPVLSDGQIIQLARLVIKIEKHYHFPCDIEWAYTQGRWYIIQSRPITALNRSQKVHEIAANTLEYMIAQYQRYAAEVIYFDYPGVIFYTGLTWHWLTEQAQQYFGTTVPFCLLFIKCGSSHLESPFYVGPGDVVFQQLAKEKLRWVYRNRALVHAAEKKWLRWMAHHHPVRENWSLKYAVLLLQKAVKLFLRHHIHLQISTQIDELLNKKIIQVFHQAKSRMRPQAIFKYCVSDTLTCAARHEEALRQLDRFSQSQNLTLSSASFAENLKNKDFRRLLQQCFNIGYALYSGYGGVVLWSMRDEYQLLVTLNQQANRKLVTRQQHMLKMPHWTQEQKTWVTIAKYFSEIRDRRKDLQQRTFYYFAQILTVISKRTNLARSDLECLLAEEVTLPFLCGRKIKKFIAKRKQGYLGFWSPETNMLEWNGINAEKIYQKIPKQLEKTKILFGQVASRGKVRGRVRIVLNPRLQKQFREGEILVAGMTSPDFVPFIQKAAAVVTERGGMTCHAAIITREFNKPCVIGTLTATKVLHDGDFVEVDANHGWVKVLT